MVTIDYVDLLNASARAAGIAVDQASGDEFTSLRVFHRDRLKRIWEYRPWHDLTRTEKRYFRALWVAQAYSAGAEVFYPGPQQYYQALRTTTSGQAPATWSGTSWVVNAAYWAVSATSYGADEYSATKAYVQGGQVYYSVTDRYYQLYASTSTGNLPTDTTKWGVLTEFNRYVAFAQTGYTAYDHSFAAWDRNPITDGRAIRLTTFHSNLGLQLLEDYSYVWLEYRIRRPLLKGDVFSATATYAVGDQVYFSSAAIRGNFYDCVTATAAAESPATAAAKWALVEIPAQFETFLIHGAAADYLTADEEADRRDREELIAQADLQNQALLHDGQLAHFNRTQVHVR
jgi:hypothetical protein